MYKNNFFSKRALFIILAFYLSFQFQSNLYSFDSTGTNRNTIWQNIGDDFMTGLNDAGAYITIPLHMSGEQWFFAAGALDALVISSTTDSALKEKVNSKSKNDYNHNFWDIPTYYGEPITAGIISGGVYLTGLFTRNNSIRITGRMLLESCLYAGVIDLALKYLTGRDRPYFNNDQYRFKSFQTKDEHVSFPSGHTTMAFTISTVLAERIDNTYARIAFYGFAALTGCARIANNKHWLSDVLTGGVLGFGTGYFIVHRENEREKKGNNSGGFSIYPSLNGINLVWKW